MKTFILFLLLGASLELDSAEYRERYYDVHNAATPHNETNRRLMAEKLADRGDGWRIIGGNAAEPGEFPWQAQLKRGGVHACGGVLVDRSWVITAAHCLTSPDLSIYQVILGEYDVTIEEGTEQRRGVARIVFHQADEAASPHRTTPYKINAADADLAMLKLTKPVTLNKMVQTLALPEPEEDFTGTVGETAGWGVSDSTVIAPVYPDILQKMKLAVLADDVCLKQLAAFNFNPATMSCATGQSSSLCWGDSGGALVNHKFADRPRLAAITSWAVECDLGTLPFVFVKVPMFVKWITSVISAT